MNIGTYGLIGIDIIELLDYKSSKEFGFVEIDKVGGTSNIQTVSNSPTRFDLKLRFVDNHAKVEDWITSAQTKTNSNLIIAGIDYGNFLIKTMNISVKYLIPRVEMMDLTLWQTL